MELPAPWAVEPVVSPEAGSANARSNGDNGVTAASGGIRSVTRRLRDRMIVELVDGATRL